MHKIKSCIKSLFNKLGYEIKKMETYSLLERRYAEMGWVSSGSLVNIGAGNFRHPCWVNVDKDNDFYRNDQSGSNFISFDLLKDKKLPFEDGSINVFYTSHTIEHITDLSVQNLFDEVYRCLKFGGLFRVTCPDMELLYRAYGLRDNYIWPQPSPWNTISQSNEERFLEHFATILLKVHNNNSEKNSPNELLINELSKVYNELDMNDFFEYFTFKIPESSNSYFPQGHCNWFTHDKIERLLTNSGFSKVYNSAYGQSQEPIMRNTKLFDSTCPELSLYVEAIK